MHTAGRWLRGVAAHAPVLLPGLAVLWAGSALLAAGWFAMSRFAYVLYLASSLRRLARNGPRTVGDDAEAAWGRFRARLSWLMDNDTVAFGALCIATRDTLDPGGPRWLTIAAGVALFVVGVTVKAWAAASLPAGSYYCRNFFVAPVGNDRSAAGPYRWLANPMYTVGYAHAYGFALCLASGPGLIGAALSQAAILLFNAAVEQPHLRAMARERAGAVRSA